jgi:hypothetical protein
MRASLSRFVLVAMILLAAGACSSSGGLTTSSAIERVDEVWGRCLALLGVSTEDATAEALPSSAGHGDHAFRVTTSDGAEWIVGVAKTKGAAVGNDTANQDIDNAEARDPNCSGP